MPRQYQLREYKKKKDNNSGLALKNTCTQEEDARTRQVCWRVTAKLSNFDYNLWAKKYV